ncbi:cobalamin biosynthesis protein [Paraburkholderia caribensis MBA4]|uniref:Cobalamin biosynthesis protein n=1 Tax=Paraburkholderia caribensis MBA4 TaxID=1323664 RepID=A0A0N7JVE6_9BURK|nr:cobalamin biosynthesis protein [Paraburkholderia caribensis MBA4]
MYWILRWHPRIVLPASGVAPVRGGTCFAFVLHALLVGVLDFALASAFC